MVFDVLQDSRGFIWMATENGINRFDGEAFLACTGQKGSLEGQSSHFLYEDGQGYIWAIDTENWFTPRDPTAIQLIDIYSGNTYSLAERFGEALPFTVEEIHNFTSDERGTLSFVLDNGQLYHFLPNGTFVVAEVALPPHLELTHYDQAGTLWGREMNGDMSIRCIGLWKLPPGDTAFQRIDLPAPAGYLHKRGGGGYTSWFWFRPTGQKSMMMAYRPDSAWKLYDSGIMLEAIQEVGSYWDGDFFPQHEQGLLWFKGPHTLKVVHPERGLIYDFQDRYPEVAESHVHTINFDRDGLAWVGTSHGLYRIELRPNRFRRYLYCPNYRQQRAEAFSCRGLWVEGDTLWACTYRGRVRVDQREESFTYLPKVVVERKGPYDYLQTLDESPLSIKKEQGRDLLFGSRALIRHNRATLEDRVMLDYLDLPGNQGIWSMYLDQADTLWLGMQHGLGAYGPDQSGIHWHPAAQPGSPLARSTVYAFVPSRQGHVWLATSTGLYAWSPQADWLLRWSAQDVGAHYLPATQVCHVYEAPHGRLWLATRKHGLIAFDPGQIDPQGRYLGGKDSAYQQFLKTDGLPNNTLYAVYPDKQGRLWMSSDYGIASFDTATHEVRTFLPRDGITHQEFNRVSHFQAADGTLYFGGLNGITSFHPDSFQLAREPLDAPLEITAFQQYDEAQGQLVDRLAELFEAGSILLRPGDRFFRLEFALLSYNQVENVRYAWQIDGFDQGWNYIDENAIRVSGLPAGKYLLRIKGQSSDGRWSTQQIALPLVVRKPIYAMVWFWVGLLMATLILAIGLYRWRVYELKRQRLKLEKLVAERTETVRQQADRLRELDQLKSRFFANVSHELRTPLTLMLGPISSVMKRHRDDATTSTYLGMAQQHGKKLLQLITELLDLSRMEAGKVQVQNQPIPLGAYCWRLVEPFQLEAARKQQTLTCTWFLPPTLTVNTDPQKLEIILNNLLTNALKFTPAEGRIEVTLSEQGEQICLAVADTGPGIPVEDLPHIFDRFFQVRSSPQPSQGGAGLGLSICAEYARLMGGELRAANRPEGGTVFEFVFPLRAVNAAPINWPQGEATETTALVPLAPEATEAVVTKPTLLLVEDHSDVQQYLSMLLGPHYHLRHAMHGQEALTWLEGQAERLPDLIISDVMMPVMDGFAMVETVKQDERWRKIPVVMLTARADQTDKLQALRIGVDDYLIKPFEEEELLARVSNLLQRADERQRSRSTQEASPALEPGSTPLEMLSSEDLAWLEQLEAQTLALLGRFDFTIDDLADHMHISRRQLHRRIKQCVGLTPNQYVLELRLQQARKRLEEQPKVPVKVVAYEAGLKDTKYFSRKFKERFGRLPSSYGQE